MISLEVYSLGIPLPDIPRPGRVRISTGVRLDPKVDPWGKWAGSAGLNSRTAELVDDGGNVYRLGSIGECQ